MGKETVTITLGDEYSDGLREALRSVLSRNGAVRVDASWGVGGSQEIESLTVRLGGVLITIEAETFMGLSMTGPQEVVADIALQVRQCLFASSKC